MSELKIMRSIMRIILPVSILILFFTVFNIRSDAINITMSSGNFGSNWEIKEEGGEIVLEIGEGQLDSGAINVEQDNDIKNITKIRFVGNVIANENSCGLFKSFQGLNSIENIERLDTSNVKIMQDMFRDCYELKELDVSNFNTEQVTNMSYMFRDCCELKELDVSNFNTEQVTNMSYMFCDCSNLKELDLNRFNTKQVTNMEFMFCNCSNLEKLDLSNFDTSNVDNMHSMFYNCQSLKELDISNFNTEQVTNMSEMFYYCNSLEELDLSNFNTSNVENMWYMFYNCHSLKELDLSSFNTEQVTNMDFMFSYCQSLKELDLSNFNTEQVKNMNYMFYCCYDLKELDLSNFNTSNIENEWTMYRVFYECTLERLTLGKKTLFAPKASLNQPSNDTLHTGYWVHEDDQEGVNFEPTTDLFLNYDGSIPGTYVWQGVQVGINLNLNDETENPQIKVLPARYGQTINLSKITKPQREGYTFKGWADTKPLADSKTKINVTKIDSLEVKTLYAIWTKKISSDSEDSSAKTVILATGKDYPDSLTASVLAYVKNAPILLSNFDSVDTTTLNEIKRIGATDII
ncbi:MAG: BspA family leucine-rich repeat surface protein, partial [Clostridioides sp.]|nr:BspA family leucine-rich repeat surface protein [Clostridioides sp.]